ncbi:hypothetical protein [Naasia sp. SYSU D00057]|uniref:hypothetical protein n=1 Tax=Naasia sp. SYSU D00057 TaxID=2817380 RepID=UPI001B310B13|nr:hypothetical protein [Naasia sp. SYSU D00057]
MILDLVRDLAESYAGRHPVRRVAAVGNQPLAPSASRAEAIDGCDLVFRVNGFTLDVDQPTVGTACHVVLFNRAVRPTPWFFEGYRERLYLMLEPGRMHWEPERYPDWWPTDLGFVTVPNREVVIPMNRDIGLDAERDGNWATTGATAAWLAGTLFPDAELHLAGFSFLDDPDQTEWEHSYGEGSIVGPEHRLSNESAWLRGWVQSGRATFHR